MSSRRCDWPGPKMRDQVDATKNCWCPGALTVSFGLLHHHPLDQYDMALPSIQMPYICSSLKIGEFSAPYLPCSC